MRAPDRITTRQVLDRIEAGDHGIVLVDAREPADWAASEELVGGAIRIPPDDAAAHVGRLRSWPLIVVYCSSPHEAASDRLARELMSRGFPRVVVLTGGLEAWKAARQPIVAKPAERTPAPPPRLERPSAPGPGR